jgi:hypothetical protein
MDTNGEMNDYSSAGNRTTDVQLETRCCADLAIVAVLIQ